MFVSEIMSKCVAECTEDLGLAEVYELIRKCEHGLVVVIDSHAHRVPIGVVNERSICEQIIVRGRNPKTLIAGSVMDSRIKTALETDLVETITELDDEVVALVVTNSKRQVCGLIPRSSIESRQSAVRGPVRRSERERASEIPAFGWVQ